MKLVQSSVTTTAMREPIKQGVRSVRQLYALGKLATFVCLLISSVVLGASAQSVVDPTKLSAETIQRQRALVEDDAS